MFKFLLVFLGGGLGSLCRFGIAEILSVFPHKFPLATLLANVLACFILGILIALSWKEQLSSQAKWLLISGFCGGFSTFSTFTGESYFLFQNGHHFWALVNVIFSLLICTISLYLGMRLAT